MRNWVEPCAQAHLGLPYLVPTAPRLPGWCLEGTPQDSSLCYFQILGMCPVKTEPEKKAKDSDNSVCHLRQVTFPSRLPLLLWDLGVGGGNPLHFPRMPFIALALSSLETCVSQTVEEASPECKSPGSSGHDLSRAHSVGGEGGDDKPAGRAN